MRKSAFLVFFLGFAVIGGSFGKVYHDSHATCEEPSQNIAAFAQDVHDKGYTINQVVTGQTLINFNEMVKLKAPDSDIPEMDMLEVVYVGEVAFVKAFNKGCTITQLIAPRVIIDDMLANAKAK